MLLLGCLLIAACGSNVGDSREIPLDQTLGSTIFERLILDEKNDFAETGISQSRAPDLSLLRQARGALVAQISDLVGYVPIVMSLSSDPQLDEVEYEAVFRRLCQEQREFLVEQSSIENVPKSGRWLLSFLWPGSGREFVGFTRLIAPNTCEVVSE